VGNGGKRKAKRRNVGKRSDALIGKEALVLKGELYSTAKDPRWKNSKNGSSLGKLYPGRGGRMRKKIRAPYGVNTKGSEGQLHQPTKEKKNLQVGGGRETPEH